MTDRETIREAVSQALKLAEVPRRERIATAVMAGFGADPTTNDIDGDESPEVVIAEYASAAVEWADALIAELDKGKP